MRLIAFPGNLGLRAHSRSLVALACGALLLTAGAGCDSLSSMNPNPGTGGRGGAGTGGTGAGGTPSGGSGGNPSNGMGGAGVGGAAGAGAGGAGTGDTGAGGSDAGGDTTNICADASAEGGTQDTDHDGVPDCLDGCPTDFNKQAPGVCGCGLSDFDSDNDGVPDCMDKCPGTPDVDSDGDGVLDCLDGCPHDGTRTVAGVCGCGVPDSTPLCLAHRYSFNDTTTTIADSITIAGTSPKNGTGTAGTIPANGQLTLAGGASTVLGGQYVTLPVGTVSTIGNNATFEAWATWSPAVATQWQRIFDFGNSDQPTGTPGNGQTYIFLSPLGGANLARAAITLASNGGNEDIADGTGSLPSNGALFHVAVVVDDAHLTMTLYVNGVPNGTPATLRAHGILSQLKDNNNWLGRSQWAPDPLYAGSITEFRIYSAALTAAQINADFSAGPDTLPAAVDGGTGTPDAGAPDAPSGQ